LPEFHLGSREIEVVRDVGSGLNEHKDRAVLAEPALWKRIAADDDDRMTLAMRAMNGPVNPRTRRPVPYTEIFPSYGNDCHGFPRYYEQTPETHARTMNRPGQKASGQDYPWRRIIEQ
jgi:hypothetical protein